MLCCFPGGSHLFVLAASSCAGLSHARLIISNLLYVFMHSLELPTPCSCSPAWLARLLCRGDSWVRLCLPLRCIILAAVQVKLPGRLWHSRRPFEPLAAFSAVIVIIVSFVPTAAGAAI